MENITTTLTTAERDFLISALLSTTDRILSKIDEDYGQEPMSEEKSTQALIDNVVANATHEIEILKEQIAERDKEINRLREEMAIPVAVHHTVKKKGLNPAPYGLKKDSTPAKKRGRPFTKGK